MKEESFDRVEIKDSGNSNTTITLEGRAVATTEARPAPGGIITFMVPGGQRMRMDGSAAHIEAGGASKNGLLALKDKDGAVQVQLKVAGEAGDIKLSNKEKTTVRLKGNDDGGEIRLFDSANTPDTASNATIHLRASDAMVRVGRKENSGDLLMLSSTGNASIHLQAGSATIRVGCKWSSGDLLMLDGEGNVSVKLSAGDATMRLGRKGLNGNLLVLDDKGEAAVRIEGKSGDIILKNSDCAEEFDIAESGEVEPGTVMVLGPEGKLQPSERAYDKRVAGVVSGAGAYRPGIVLGRGETSNKRMPIALLGKTYCKVDALSSPVEVGDLLTTSATPGHAMRADDPARAFGAVIGKALRPVKEGKALIPILIALQ